jgi:hypothetical protein
VSDFNDRPQFQPPAFQPPAPPAPSGAGGLAPSGPPTTPIEFAPSPAPKRKRSKGVIVGAAVAAVAIVGAGVFAITKAVGNDDDKGGAASSTEAGEQFVKALNDEDILGAVDLLLPGERETFRQPMIDLVDNLKRLDVLNADADPSKVSGVDIDLTNVEVTADKPVADDIDTIRISAKDESTVNGKALPLGDIIVNEALGGKRPDTTSKPSGSPANLTVTTVEKDGRWYLSLFYSIAESVRQDSAKSKPVPTDGVALAGADQPEGAVDQMINAATKLDIETMIGGLNPNEAEAFQRYAPIFLDRADKRAQDLGVSVTYSDASYTVTGSGDHRNVTIASFTLTVKDGDQDVKIEVKDGCATITTGDQNLNSCDASKDLDKTLQDAGLGDDDNPQLKDLITTIQKAFDDFKGTGIAVDKVGGKWYVSPIGTWFDGVDAVLGALDKDELQDIIDAFKKLDLNGVSLPGIGEDTGASSPDTAPIDTEVPVTDETTVDTEVPETFPTADTTSDTFPDIGAPSAEDFRSQTEAFILGSQVAEQVGLSFTSADCATPVSTTVGTGYTCTAFTADGKQFSLQVEITSPSGFTIQSVDPA